MSLELDICVIKYYPWTYSDGIFTWKISLISCPLKKVIYIVDGVQHSPRARCGGRAALTACTVRGPCSTHRVHGVEAVQHSPRARCGGRAALTACPVWGPCSTHRVNGAGAVQHLPRARCGGSAALTACTVWGSCSQARYISST